MSNENRHEAADFGVVGGSYAREDIQEISNTELLDEIIHMVEAQLAEEMDVDAIMERLALLQERAPVDVDHTPVEILENLEEKHPLIFEGLADGEEPATTLCAEENVRRDSKPRRQRQGRFIYYIAGAFAACFCLVVTANAFGFNPVRTFLDWAEEIILIYSDPSGTMELSTDDPSQYHSLREALIDLDMGPENTPTWIPADYAVTTVGVRTLGNTKQCSAIYESDQGEFLIRVTRFPHGRWSGFEEYTEGSEQREINGDIYYIASNLEQMKAGWQRGDVSYTVSGQITEKELLKMIDSIG